MGKAMKKAAGSANKMTASAANAKVAEQCGVKAKQVKTIVESFITLAAGEIKKNGSFKLGGCLNLKLKKKPATAARKGINPFPKDPVCSKANPASKTVKAY